MRKTFLFAAAALCMAVACTKPTPELENNQSQPDNSKVHEIEIELSSHGTRALTTEDEAKVNDLQVFVFRGDELDAYADAKNASSLTVSCTSGEREIYALVNAPDYSAVASKAALLAKVSQLSANSLTNFEMIGKKTVTLPGTKSVSIDVNRLAARVAVKKITRKFASAAHQALDFTVNKIYLVNVAKDINYGITGTPTGWYNEAKDKSEVAALLCDAPDAAIVDKASHATAHYFYAYPNKADTKTTRLVIETTLGSTKYYYPINLPALESNKSYEIAEVTITRPGSNDPDVPVSFDDIQFSINVVDWTVVPVTEGTTI